MKRNEKAITLISLVISIIILVILASIGVTASKSSIQSSKYEVFKTELKVIQTKINEISEEYIKDNKQIGEELTDVNKQVLDTTEVVEQLTKKAEDSGSTIQEIKNGFRLCTSEYIKQELEIDNITGDYIVNLQQCIVISAESFKYEGTNYYMLEQMEDGLYNVTYKNQIESTGNFTATANANGEVYNITITPEHQKYVSKWKIKYRLQGSTYWETTNNLTFTVNKKGTYEIQVTHGNEVDLGTKTIKIE